MNLYEMVSKSLVADDNGRDRSLQVEIGASSVGGCRRSAWHIIKETPKTNFKTEKLAAILGTAIHSHMAEAIKVADPFGDDFLIEEGFRVPELKGHVDLYIKSTGQVVDWKSTTLKGLEKFPNRQQKIQVSLYGYMLKENGYDVKKVALVGIPRDGKMDEIKVWEADYDPKLAQAGLDWLADVRNRDEAPAPEKTGFYCQNYCDFYDPTGQVGCPSK